MSLDPVELSKTLIKIPSITPKDEGSIDYVSDILKKLGFRCEILEFGENEKVRNIYARKGDASPNLCFCGHVDVVPPGDLDKWTYPPFSAEIRDGILYGRGAADMKSALCAYIAAVSQIIFSEKIKGSLSFIVTSDEEGTNPQDGTKAVLEWLKRRNEKIDFCIVGEATSSEQLGDIIKIGRRGLLQLELKCYGKQGHAGYPELADNPIEKMIDILYRLKSITLDAGNQYFQPSRLVITSIDVGNRVRNIIPDYVRAYFTVRYNTEQTNEKLITLIENVCNEVATNRYELISTPSGDAFLLKDQTYAEKMISVIRRCTGKTAKISTGGGTSDARFVKDYCNVLEFGLVNKTIHQINECVPIDDIRKLTEIYREFIKDYFHS